MFIMSVSSSLSLSLLRSPCLPSLAILPAVEKHWRRHNHKEQPTFCQINTPCSPCSSISWPFSFHLDDLRYHSVYPLQSTSRIS